MENFNSKKYIVTWDMIQHYSKILSLKLYSLKKKYNWKKIIAISRGGLVPCTIITRELNIRYIDTICISSYDHNFKKKIKVLKKSLIKQNYKKILIVDDLVDTGKTAKIVKNLYPNSYFITIFAKPLGKNIVDNYVIDIPQNTWIEQPWDMEYSYVPPIVEKKKNK